MITFFNRAALPLLIFLACSTSSFASNHLNMMILGYDGNAWYPYLGSTRENRWEKITQIRDPAYLTWDKANKHFFIKNNAGQLVLYDVLDQKMTDLKTNDQTFTQLRASRQGLVMVELIEGKSRDTRIVSLDEQGNLKKLIRQDSAQFHPYQINKQLFYAHVSCRIECNPLIQEVWKKDRTTGRTKQLTLLNATTYLHSVDLSGKYGFLTSNQSGFYHLARLDVTTGTVHWLTQGQVTDSFPSITQTGELFFIRRTPKGSRLMKLSAAAAMGNTNAQENALQTIALPEDIQKIRYLEIIDL